MGGFFAISLVPAATGNDVHANELVHRLGLGAHTIVTVTNLPLAVIFWDLFKVVNRRAALMVVFFTLHATAVESAKLLEQFAALVPLDGGRHPSPSADLQTYSYNLSVVYFGFYRLAIGYLLPSPLGEASLTLWLLLGGLNIRRWEGVAAR